MSQKKPLIGVLLFAGVFLYLGWEIVRQDIGFLQGGSASENWPTVDGQIISSSVESSYSSGGSGVGSSRYDPIVEYEYSVEGESFTGDRISFAQQSYSHNTSAEAITKRYSVGRTVPVSYDPEDAANSVLEPGVESGNWLGIGVGIIFAAVAGRMLFTRLRRSGS